jgi:hypothetical protein
VIRLGTLGGYPFEGPRVLGGWHPPSQPGLFVVLTRQDQDSQRYEVIYVGHADDLSTMGLPFQHSHAESWIERAGSKWNLSIGYYVIPGGTRSHRERITEELIAIYRPSCNTEQFERAWKEEWIGTYEAPTAKPLTTRRDSPPS